MDENKFQSEKRRILEARSQWKVFERVLRKIDIDMRRPETVIGSSEPDKACQEWGWPNDEAHHDLTLKVLQEFLQKYCNWKFRVRNVIEANLLPDHHGIGVRIDDYKSCKQWSGVLVRCYDAVAAKGDKDFKREMKASKSPPPEPKKEVKAKKVEQVKDDDKSLKKSKSWKSKMGLKKSKKKNSDAGDDDEGEQQDDDDDYFH